MNKEIISFNQKLFRLKEKTLRVGVYGKAGVGKSSILNSILKEDFFQTGILNGSTKEILLKEYFLNSRKINKIELIDTPGFDVCNFQNQIKFFNNKVNLDIVIFTVSGDLNRSEFEALNSFIAKGQQIIIVLNKIDIWCDLELEEIIRNIKQKLPNQKIPIIKNSNKISLLNNNKLNIRNFLIKTVNNHGETLLILNTLEFAEKFYQKIIKNRLQKRKKEAQSVIGKFATLKASSVALNPLVFFDIAGSFALDALLIKELSEVYGLKIKGKSARKLVKKISINNIYLVVTQIGINISFNLIRKISLITAPLTSGLSLLPYGPVAFAQAALAIKTTKTIGKLAAEEILIKSQINNLEPFQIIQKIGINEAQIIDYTKNLTYNNNKNDFSILLP